MTNRYPDSVAHLVLLDTGGDSRWPRQNAADVLAKRGYSPETVELVRRFFNGQIEPREMFLPAMMKFGKAYYSHPSLLAVVRDLIRGEWRMKARAGDAHLRGSPSAQGLDGHGPARRDQGLRS